MLEPGARIVGIQSVEMIDDALWLHVFLSDGTTACTWWPLDEMPSFLTRTGVDASPRPPGIALQ